MEPEEIKKAETASTNPDDAANASAESQGEYKGNVMEFLQKGDPDLEINDDNYVGLMEKAMSEDVIPKINAYDDANNNLRAMMADNPNLGKVLADMSKGAKFEEALPRYYDTQAMVLEEGDPDYVKWEAANKERMGRYQENLDLETQLENNRAKSKTVINSWFKERGMPDEEKGEYGAFVKGVLERAYEGEVTPEFLNKMYYAMKYKDDVAGAAAAGEVKGKNAAIVEDDALEKAKGDGMPSIEGGVVEQEAEALPDNADPFVQGLRGMASRKSVIDGNY